MNHMTPNVSLAPLICPDVLLWMAVAGIGCAVLLVRDFGKSPEGKVSSWDALARVIETHRDMLFAIMIVLLNFLGASLFIIFCPRYLTMAAPALFLAVGLTVFRSRRHQWFQYLVLGSALIWNLANQYGQLYPSIEPEIWSRYSEHDKILERSREYLAVHRSTVETTRHLSSTYSDAVIYTARPFGSLLGLPSLGYIAEPMTGYATGHDSRFLPAFQEASDAEKVARERPLTFLTGRYTATWLPTPPVEPDDEVLLDSPGPHPLRAFRKVWKEGLPEKKGRQLNWLERREWPGNTFAEKVKFRAEILAADGRSEMATDELRAAAYAHPEDKDLQMAAGIWFLSHHLPDDALSCFKHATAVDANISSAHYYIGTIYLGKQQTDTALLEFEKEYAINPGHEANAIALANLYLSRNRAADASNVLAPFRELQSTSAMVWYFSGIASANLAEWRRAKAELEKAITLAPDLLDAKLFLVEAAINYGDFATAESVAGAILAAVPNHPIATIRLAITLAAQGKVSQAVPLYRNYLSLNPNDIDAKNQLAWILATAHDDSIRNGAEAVELAESANQSTGGESPAVLDTLAAAYAEAGRFVEARKTIHQAIMISINQGNEDLAKQYRKRQELYNIGLPYHVGM